VAVSIYQMYTTVYIKITLKAHIFQKSITIHYFQTLLCVALGLFPIQKSANTGMSSSEELKCTEVEYISIPRYSYLSWKRINWFKSYWMEDKRESSLCKCTFWVTTINYVGHLHKT
jgi:hypothetical protein